MEARTLMLPPEVIEATPRVVLVDVRSERRAVMAKMVNQAVGEGTVVAEVTSALEAVSAAERQPVDAAVVEVQMPIADGLEVITALRAAHPQLLIVVCSFHQDLVTQRLAAEAGADSYLVKPVNSRDLRRALGQKHQGSEAVTAL